MEFPPHLTAALDELKARYPIGTAVLIPALHAVQQEFGHLPLEAEARLAKHFGVPAVRVREVSTFYFMFHNRPVGRHLLYVCGNLTCWLRGYETVLSHLERRLGIQAGETTPDGRFTLMVVECLGMCEQAPVIQIDGEFHGRLTPESLDRLLDELP